jgi:FMN phosphatase YigB (HAD superfamily)
VEETKLNALGLRPYFDNVVLHDAAVYQRSLYPVGEALRAVLGRLSIPPGQCLLVADNPFCDFIAARDAGALSARTYEGHYADSLYPAREYSADFELSAVAHLPELMRGELRLLTPFPLPRELFTAQGPVTQHHTLLKYW